MANPFYKKKVEAFAENVYLRIAEASEFYYAKHTAIVCIKLMVEQATARRSLFLMDVLKYLQEKEEDFS